MLDLYINYDCDVACTNLFEELCRCLCRNAIPDDQVLTSLHVLSLEGVLAVVENMARRCFPPLRPLSLLPLVCMRVCVCVSVCVCIYVL